jgi:hypothetical protein
MHPDYTPPLAVRPYFHYRRAPESLPGVYRAPETYMVCSFSTPGKEGYYGVIYYDGYFGRGSWIEFHNLPIPEQNNADRVTDRKFGQTRNF